MKAFRKLKFSIGFLLLLTAVIGFITSRVVKLRAQITTEMKVYEALRECGVQLIENKPTPNLAERVLGIQLQPSEFTASLRWDQNRHFYDLTKLGNLKELTISFNTNANLPNLAMFRVFENLERLRVYEWWCPETMNGVQSLSKLKHLEIWDVESPEKIDLTALADHPTLEEFQIGDYPLDKAKRFQVLPDF